MLCYEGLSDFFVFLMGFAFFLLRNFSQTAGTLVVHVLHLGNRSFHAAVHYAQKTELFEKRSSNWRNLKTPALLFRMDGKHFENGTFRKRWRHDNHVISLTEFSLNTNPK